MLLQKFWYNLSENKSTDFELVVKSDKYTVKFPCHRYIISQISDVFKEKCLSYLNQDNIVITNIKPNIMFLMLNYIYNRKLYSSEWTTTIDLMTAALSYNITSLSNTCTKSLIKSLDLTNSCSILEFAIEYSISKLYTKSLAICINAAFIVLDSADFDTVKPSTIIHIISQQYLNIRNEAEVLYALWMHTTLNIYRNNIEASYDNIVQSFEIFSPYVDYESVTEENIKAYENDYLTKYFTGKITSGIFKKPLKTLKRKITAPQNLPPRLYLNHEAGYVKTVNTLQGDGFYIAFSLSHACFLIQLRVACSPSSSYSESNIESMHLVNNENIIFKWNRCEDFSAANLIQNEIYFTTSLGKLKLEEFCFMLPDLVRLQDNQIYHLQFKFSANKIVWPEFYTKENNIIIIHNNINCLTHMKLLPIPLL